MKQKQAQQSAGTKYGKPSPTDAMQAQRTAANKMRNAERELKRQRKAAEKQWKHDIEAKRLLDLAYLRGVKIVALPDRHSRQAVREWQMRKAERNLNKRG